MNNIFQNYKKTGYLHHAHVIEGMHDTIAPLLVEAIREHLNIEAQGNPDVTIEYYDSLGVDEAHDLKAAQTRAGFDGKKIFIIGTESFTPEAQNALLKTFEEPTEGTHFFIIIPRAEMLLPTLRSRVLVVQNMSMKTDDEARVLAEKFIDASLEGRFAIAKKMAEKKAGETVDRELFRRMLDHIERILYTRTAGNRDEKVANVFREIFQAKTYLANRGSSPKMLLEHIAMIIPNR
ncbi:MAG: hypothetical protein WC791_04185 [Candidatus Paceibacterota bacterium]